MELEKLKKDYEKIQKKYSLPAFSELNQNFEVEKIEHETELLLGTIRKIMMEKIVNSLGFSEMLLSPMNAPQMYHAFIKSMSLDEKNSLEKVYKNFAELNLLSLEREIIYHEKAEAELVKKIFKSWSDVRPDFKKIISGLLKPNSKTDKKDRSYFG